MAPNDQLRGLSDEERAYYSLSERVYRVFAPFYDAVTRPIRRLRRDVVDMVGAGNGKVLDVATGTGAQARAFADASADVTAVDLSEAMLRIARRKHSLPNLEFVRGDAAALPFADGAFDVSCISFALHEMPRTVRQRVLQELARVTRPGGTVVVVDYALPRRNVARWLVYHFVKLYERDHYADFVHSDLGRLLEEAGVRGKTQHSMLLGAVRVWIGARDDASRLGRPSHGTRDAMRAA